MGVASGAASITSAAWCNFRLMPGGIVSWTQAMLACASSRMQRALAHGGRVVEVVLEVEVAELLVLEDDVVEVEELDELADEVLVLLVAVIVVEDDVVLLEVDVVDDEEVLLEEVEIVEVLLVAVIIVEDDVVLLDVDVVDDDEVLLEEVTIVGSVVEEEVVELLMVGAVVTGDEVVVEVELDGLVDELVVVDGVVVVVHNEIGVWRQPSDASQASNVQVFWSSQSPASGI